MKIEVIGSGCHTCELLHKKVLSFTEKNNLKADVFYLKDVNELIERGIMGSPALVIDGKVACVGMPSDEKLEQLLRQ